MYTALHTSREIPIKRAGSRSTSVQGPNLPAHERGWESERCPPGDTNAARANLLLYIPLYKQRVNRTSPSFPASPRTAPTDVLCPSALARFLSLFALLFRSVSSSDAQPFSLFLISRLFSWSMYYYASRAVETDLSIATEGRVEIIPAAEFDLYCMRLINSRTS